MRFDRFFTPFDRNTETLTLTAKDTVHQIRRVLRKKEGDVIMLCNGESLEATGLLTKSAGNEVRLMLSDFKETQTETDKPYTLCVAVLKRENTELVVQKATELGIAHIILLDSDHTIKKGVPLPRLLLIAQEAAEQSGRGKIPSIEHMPFARACELFAHNGAFLDTENTTTSLVKTTCESIFVGPEGGWSPAERTLAASYNLPTVSLGKRILRAETAAIVAAAHITETL